MVRGLHFFPLRIELNPRDVGISSPPAHPQDQNKHKHTTHAYRGTLSPGMSEPRISLGLKQVFEQVCLLWFCAHASI